MMTKETINQGCYFDKKCLIVNEQIIRFPIFLLTIINGILMILHIQKKSRYEFCNGISILK